MTAWKLPENRSVNELGREPRGFRDLMWCPYLNEPAFVRWTEDGADCPNCHGNFEAETHVFIGHVEKPFFKK